MKTKAIGLVQGDKKINLGPLGKMQSIAQSFRNDGWKNILTGLGVAGKDKRLGANATYSRMVETDMEHIYGCDDIAAKTVDLIPGEGTREWIEYTLDEDKGGKEKIKEVDDYNEELQVQSRFQTAWNWSRLYGGSGLLIAVDDGVADLAEPMNIENIRSVKSLTPLTRFELHPMLINRDILSKNFFKPETYQVTPRVSQVGSVIVHHTRIIRFDGARLPRNLFQQNNYWHDSVLNRLFNPLRNYNLANDSVASVLQEFKVGVLKLKNLADLIAQDEEDVLRKRVEIMNLTKSVLNTVILDAEDEDFTNMTTPLTGMEGVMKTVESRMVAATGMPHTLILGEGAAGFLSGAGNAEKEQFSDFIKVHQTTDIKDQVKQWNRIMEADRQGPFAGKKDPKRGLGFDFKPLWQMDDKDNAELRNKQASTDAIYHSIGALDSDEIRTSRFGGDDFSLETSIDTSGDSDLNSNENEEDDFNSDAFDPDGPHSHYDFLQNTFTGSATDGNPADPQHTHTRSNGKQTGPAIPIPGGNHTHTLNEKIETGEAVSLEFVKRIDEAKEG